MTYREPAYSYTQIAETTEQRLKRLFGRYSKTSAERVEIAREVGMYENAYRLEGGQNFIGALEAVGFTHSTAVNLRNAGRALKAGLVSKTNSVTELAELGRLLNIGSTKTEAQELQKTKAVRSTLAQAAGIGLSSVPFPAGHIEEVAESLVRVKRGFEAAGIEPPDTAELALTAARILNRLEEGDFSRLITSVERFPEAKRAETPKLAALTFYAHLVSRSPRSCQYPGCADPATQIHHVPIWDDLTKRGHALEGHNVLDLCLRHHQTGTAGAAAHGEAGFTRWAETGWGSVTRLFAAMYREHALWAQALLQTRTEEPHD